jgi:hypothetical protein
MRGSGMRVYQQGPPPPEEPETCKYKRDTAVCTNKEAQQARARTPGPQDHRRTHLPNTKRLVVKRQKHQTQVLSLAQEGVEVRPERRQHRLTNVCIRVGDRSHKQVLKHLADHSHGHAVRVMKHARDGHWLVERGGRGANEASSNSRQL